MKKFHLFAYMVLAPISVLLPSRANGIVPRQDTVKQPKVTMQEIGGDQNFGTAAYYKRNDVRQAVALYTQQKHTLIDQARVAFRKKDYQSSANLYEQAYHLRPSLPDSPTSDIPPLPSRTMLEAGEWGESLAAQGKIDEAIQAYRHIVYQENTFSSVSKFTEMSPLTQLPLGARSLDEAILRFPNAKIINWVCNEPCVLARYALLLVEANHYEEAITVYNRAVKYLSDSPYQNALVLDGASTSSFDKRRFVAAAHTIVADKTGSAIEIYYGYYNHKEIRTVWENELRTAVEVKPDFTPALVALADVLVVPGEPVSSANKQFAKECMDKAVASARSAAQHELIDKKMAQLKEKIQ